MKPLPSYLRVLAAAILWAAILMPSGRLVLSAAQQEDLDSVSELKLECTNCGQADLNPYLSRVQERVRHTWVTMRPKSAQEGEVVLLFAVARDGALSKIVYVTQSGNASLDRSTVTALSASEPLAALPSIFKGDRLVVRATFRAYKPR